MPIKRPQLANDEIYHVVMRGVDGMIIYPDERDYLHFLHDLYEFNDEDGVSWEFRVNSTRTVLAEFGGQKKKERKLLVEILLFCLMPNHFHLLLRQVKDNGISRFMRKLGGYATYINKKYGRQGHLYQGRFKAIHIENDNQLRNVFAYIHTNPMSLIEPNWKSLGIKDSGKAAKFIENYKWSSYLDYIGIKNYPSLISSNFLMDVFGTKENCHNCINDYILYKKDISQLTAASLE